MVTEVASRQTSFLGWFMRLFMVFFFFSVQSVYTTQHCCLSETELNWISHLTEIRVPNTVYTGMCVLSFRTHAHVCAVPLMFGRLTDGQAEPNLHCKYQGGRMIGKVGLVRQGIFNHQRLSRLRICNSIAEHILRRSAHFGPTLCCTPGLTRGRPPDATGFPCVVILSCSGQFFIINWRM